MRTPLPAELLAKLSRVELATRRPHPGRSAARRRSTSLGAGIDFADHRPYSPGDDVASIDWMAYGRFEQLLVRLSEQETDLQVHIVVDASASMLHGIGNAAGDSKLDVAELAALCLAYCAFANLDTATLWTMAQGSVRGPTRLGSRPEHLGTAWERIGQVQEGGTAKLDDLARRLTEGGVGRGLVIVLTDALDDSVGRALGRLHHGRFDVSIVLLAHPTERAPSIDDGRVDLVDAETGERVKGVDAAWVRQAVGARADEWRVTARRLDIAVCEVQTGDPTSLERVVLHALRRAQVLR